MCISVLIHMSAGCRGVQRQGPQHGDGLREAGSRVCISVLIHMSAGCRGVQRQGPQHGDGLREAGSRVCISVLIHMSAGCRGVQRQGAQHGHGAAQHGDGLGVWNQDVCISVLTHREWYNSIPSSDTALPSMEMDCGTQAAGVYWRVNTHVRGVHGSPVQGTCRSPPGTKGPGGLTHARTQAAA